MSGCQIRAKAQRQNACKIAVKHKVQRKRYADPLLPFAT